METQALVMLAVMGAVGLLQWQAAKMRVPPMPSRRDVRTAALGLLAGENPAKIIDLGSGWGGMAARLACAFPKAEVWGYERSALPRLCARLFHPRIKVINADLFGADIADADIVYCYLTPWHMARLAPKFDAELKSGALVVSASFPIAGREAEKQTLIKGIVDIPVYLYRW